MFWRPLKNTDPDFWSQPNYLETLLLKLVSTTGSRHYRGNQEKSSRAFLERTGDPALLLSNCTISVTAASSSEETAAIVCGPPGELHGD